MTAMPDPSDAIRRLESAGAEPKLAAAIASLLPTAAKPTVTSTIVAASRAAIPTIVVLFLIAVTGWFIVDAINASTARIETLAERTADLGERITRVETLIRERLPPLP